MALSSIDTAGLCGIEYIYWPISDYRKLIFSQVISKVTAGDILDLGCGQAGIYWALAYVSKAKSICFFDYHQENLDQVNTQLSLVSPTYIEENFADTLQFLYDSELVSSSYDMENIATMLLEKIDQITQYDFRVLSASKTFDTIISIESIECVNSFEELLSVLRTCHTLLNTNGRLIGICLRYNQATERTKSLVQMRFEGELNPTEDQLRTAFQQSDFKINELKTVLTSELYNYGEAVLFNVSKA